MVATTATARKSAKRIGYRLNHFKGTFTLHGQYGKSLVNGLFYPAAESTEKHTGPFSHTTSSACMKWRAVFKLLLLLHVSNLLQHR